MFLKRTNIQGLSDSEWMSYAVSRTGVDMPNCFTYATARLSEILGEVFPLDGYTRVNGAQDLWTTHNSQLKQSKYASKGALMIWKYGTWGHVAVCEDIISDYEVAWSQSNYGGSMFDYVTGNPNGYCGMEFLGYLVCEDVTVDTEPTSTVVDMKNVIKENGTMKFTVDHVNVRKGNPVCGRIVAQYNKGDTVVYWGKWIGNGHRYICYTGASGNTNFVAVSGSEIYGKDKWAEVV